MEKVLVTDTDGREKPATLNHYPSDGEFAIVTFDGEADPLTVHKTRIGDLIAWH